MYVNNIIQAHKMVAVDTGEMHSKGNCNKWQISDQNVCIILHQVNSARLLWISWKLKALHQLKMSYTNQNTKMGGASQVYHAILLLWYMHVLVF